MAGNDHEDRAANYLFYAGPTCGIIFLKMSKCVLGFSLCLNGRSENVRIQRIWRFSRFFSSFTDVVLRGQKTEGSGVENVVTVATHLNAAHANFGDSPAPHA